MRRKKQYKTIKKRIEKYFPSLTDTKSWQEEFIYFQYILNTQIVDSKTKEKHNLSPQQNRQTTNTDISQQRKHKVGTEETPSHKDSRDMQTETPLYTED